MRQISLKINRYISGISIINSSAEKITLNIILGSLGLLSLLYVLFLGNMVANIVERKSLEADIRVLSGEVGQLELTYLSMSNEIDLTLSMSMGFEEAKPTFATRKSLGMETSGSSAKILSDI